MDGQPFIHYGVVLFIEPDDPSAVHAAMPLSTASPELVERNVQEACRVLPQFLDSVPKLKPQLIGRQLVVRMIAAYDDLDNEIGDRVIRPIDF
jgi:hypothetical protein